MSSTGTPKVFENLKLKHDEGIEFVVAKGARVSKKHMLQTLESINRLKVKLQHAPSYDEFKEAAKLPSDPAHEAFVSKVESLSNPDTIEMQAAVELINSIDFVIVKGNERSEPIKYMHTLYVMTDDAAAKEPARAYTPSEVRGSVNLLAAYEEKYGQKLETVMLDFGNLAGKVELRRVVAARLQVVESSILVD